MIVLLLPFKYDTVFESKYLKKNFKKDITLFVKERHSQIYKENLSDYKNIKIIGIKKWSSSNQLELEIVKLHSKKKIKKIINLSEDDIIRVGIMREKLDITGLKKGDSIKYKDKYNMKIHAKNKNINCPNFKKVNNFFDVLDFINIHGYPVILKPRKGHSSIGVRKITSFSSLQEQIDKINIQDCIIEEFISGKVYHIDGLYQNDNLYNCVIGEYINDALVHKFSDHSTTTIFLKCNDENFKKIRRFTQKVLTNFPKEELLAFHLEVIIDKNDIIYFCEISCRFGGGEIIPTINKAFNINFYELYINFLIDKEQNINFSNEINWDKYYGFVMSSPKSGELKYIEKNINYSWVDAYTFYGKVGTKYLDNDSCVGCVGSFICHANTKKLLKYRLEYIDRWFKDNCTYE